MSLFSSTLSPRRVPSDINTIVNNLILHKKLLPQKEEKKVKTFLLKVNAEPNDFMSFSRDDDDGKRRSQQNWLSNF